MSFISVTKQGNPVSYNTQYIVAIGKTDEGTILVFHDNSSTSIIEEPYNEVIKQITKEELFEPVKHGHWIYKELWEDLDNRNFKGYTCSCCNEEYEDYLFDSYELNYCPNCGAKMDKKV